jgi:DNA-directed RNA polymerase specialized sigma24 family protein
MEESETFAMTARRADDPPDAEILLLLRREPARAWDLFIGRYADFIFTQLRALGFDYDQAMDRFVYVCEKLAEDDFRRLRTVRYAGERGQLTPWLRQVIKRLCINWAWSAEGRRRLCKPVARLPARERRAFELYFWQGLAPPEIYEQLRLDAPALKYVEVLEALERVFAVLNQQNLWNLLCQLARRRGPVPLDELEDETGLEPPDPNANPEEILQQKETAALVTQSLAALSALERVAAQLHFTESLTVKEVAEILRRPEREVKNALKTALNKLRRFNRR